MNALQQSFKEKFEKHGQMNWNEWILDAKMVQVTYPLKDGEEYALLMTNLGHCPYPYSFEECVAVWELFK